MKRGEEKARGLRQHRQSQPSDYVFLVEETKYKLLFVSFSLYSFFFFYKFDTIKIINAKLIS
jgi:hypothetical protein